MNISITLTAPDYAYGMVDSGACGRINDRIDMIAEEHGLDYDIWCQPSSDNWLPMNKIEFLVDGIDRLAVTSMMELVHGLIFEEFDVEFE